MQDHTPLECPEPRGHLWLLRRPGSRGQLLRIFYSQTCKRKKRSYFHVDSISAMCWYGTGKRGRAFWSRSLEVPWILAKGARVLVLFTVETVGGRLGGTEEGEQGSLPSSPASVGSCDECSSFLPPRMPQEGKLDFFLKIKFWLPISQPSLLSKLLENEMNNSVTQMM